MIKLLGAEMKKVLVTLLELDVTTRKKVIGQLRGCHACLRQLYDSEGS